MPSTPKPAAKLTCAGPGCRKRFTPQRSTAKFCSPSCSQRARRGTKKPAQKPAAAKPAPAVEAEKAKAEGAPKRQPSPKRSTASADAHELVMALRKELEDARALDTFEGQLALELARRLVTPGEGASSLADKVRAARAAALEQAKPPTGGDDTPPPAEDDEVTKARRAKEAKAAAAAASEA